MANEIVITVLLAITIVGTAFARMKRDNSQNSQSISLDSLRLR